MLRRLVTLVTGFQPIGQNGLRPLASIVKADLFLHGGMRGGIRASWSSVRRAKLESQNRNRQEPSSSLQNRSGDAKVTCWNWDHPAWRGC